MLRQTPIWAQSLTGVVISLGLIGVIAGILFRIDEVVTVQGQLVSVEGSVGVKTPVGGKVADVLFKDGQVVRKGDLLVQFDTRQAISNRNTTLKLITLEESDLDDKLQILEQQKKVLAKKLDTSKKMTNELEKLVSMGGFQKMQYLQQLDALFEQETQLSNIKLEINRANLESEKIIKQLNNSLQEAELQLQYQKVKAPTNGIIFEQKASKDGVLRAGDTVLTIIPQGKLKAKVFVANKDIGFIKSGQDAKIRVDAFPFTSYGELTGKISSIGADVLEPDATADYYRYPVSINLDKSYLKPNGRKIPLRSGMAITTNLKLRDKRLISLISDMLVDQTDSIKGIRQQ